MPAQMRTPAGCMAAGHQEAKMSRPHAGAQDHRNQI